MLPTVSCTLCNAKTASASDAGDDLLNQSNTAASAVAAPFLPCPVHLHLEKLCVYSSKDSKKQICVYPINLSAYPAENHLAIATHEPINIHLEASSDSWINACFETAIFSLENGTFEPKSFRCEGLHVGPFCSFGEASLDLPSFEMVQGSKEVNMGGVARCKVQSMDVVSSIQHLIMGFLDTVSSTAGMAVPESDSGCMTANVPEGSLEISDLGARVSVHGLIANASHLSCVRILMSGAQGASASVSGIRVDGLTGPAQVVTLDWIDALFLPGSVSLAKPVGTAKLAYTAASGLCAEFSKVAAVMLDNGSTAPSEIMDLPFPIHCSVKELLLEMKVANEGIKTWNIQGLQIDAKPVQLSDLLSGTWGTQGSTKRIHICATVDQLNNGLLEASRISANGIYGPSNVFSNLQARVGKASVATGFSSIEWSQLVETGGENKVVWMLPHAHIERFKAGVAYKGKLVSTETVIHLYAFTGDATTTIDDVVSHYSTTALQQMPSLISGASLLGENVVDMGARNVGSMALRGTLKGSVGGSVGGLVAVDGIRGAIQSGKKSRGATEEDRYHFGDFSKGLVRSVKESAKSGASMRQGESDSYEFGDFSRGATAGMGKYAGNNKERLGSAGGSSLGMAVGAVALGPIGLVAGSILGAKAGAKAFASSKESAEADFQKQDQYLVEQEANLGNDSLLPSAPQSTLYEQDPFEMSGNAKVLPSASIPTSQNPTVTKTDDFFEDFGLSQPNNAQQPGQCPTNFQQQPARAQAASHYSYQQPQQLSMEGSDDPMSFFASSNSSNQAQTSQYQPPATQSVNHRVQQPTQPQYQTQQATPVQYNYQHQTVPSQYHNSEQQQATQSHYGTQQQSQTTYQQQATSSQSAAHKHQLHQQQAASARHAQMQQRQAPPTQSQGYHFGDVTRSVVAQGKKNSGRSEKSGYQFGDFTRGLFGGKK